MRSRLLVVVLVAAGLTALAQQPPPQRRGRQEAPPLDIQQYKPASMLVVDEHQVPKAKYPVVDVHSHLPVSRLTAAIPEMDALNLRILVNLSGGSGQRFHDNQRALEAHPHRDRMVLFANVDFDAPFAAGFGAKAAQALEGHVKAGARGLKIFKTYGLHLKDPAGARVPVDAPEMDPVWAAAGRLRVPVLIHTGEPPAFFLPIDTRNERWLELQLFPNRRIQPPEFPSFDTLMAERDRMFAKHPQTRFIAAHFAYHANDLKRLGALLDRLPNVYVEVAAILAELGRQPRAAHDFFVRYQDRILFGKDIYAASEYPSYWRTFETADEYFDYYRDYHAFWKLYGMDLPDAVLRKLYYGNALRLIPGLPAGAFPES